MLLSYASFAQNHVINGDFEYRSGCPSIYGQVVYCDNWRQYTGGTSDYYNECASNTSPVNIPKNWPGYQSAASGQAYAGGFVYIQAPNFSKKEYLAGEMIPLVTGRAYEVSMSVSLADSLSVATNDLGVFFYKNGPYTLPGTGVLSVTPQVSFSSYGPITDTSGWVRLTKTFFADSSYDNIVIGGFMENNQLTKVVIADSSFGYYYIDSVVVKPYDSISISANDTVYCVGDSVHIPLAIFDTASYTSGSVFTLQLSNTVGSFSTPINIGQYTGYLSDTISGLIPNNIHSSSVYKLRAVASSGNIISNEVTIRIDNPDSVGMNLSYNAPLCVRDTLHLSATSTYNVTDYIWSNTSGFLSSMQDVYIPQITASHAGVYYVSASYHKCSILDSITINIKSEPPVPIASHRSPICLGDSILLTAITTVSGVSFSWRGPNTFTSNDQFPVRLNASYADSGFYYVYAVKDGCSSLEDSVHINLNDKKQINIASNKDTICDGQEVMFHAMPGTYTQVKYEWYLNNQLISGVNTDVYKSTTLQSGDIVHCVLLDSMSCLRPYTDTSTYIQVGILPWLTPSANITVTPQGPITQGDSLTFSATTFNAATPAYQWKRNGIDIPNATGQSWVSDQIVDNDTICLEINSGYRCAQPLTVESNCITVNVLSAIDIVKDISSLRLYPNPNKGSFILEGEINSTTYKISVTNTIGQKVFVLSGIVSNNSLRENILLEQAHTGVYLLTINTDSDSATFRFVVDE